MNTAIYKAIVEQRLLTFQYKGKLRRVESHTFGRQVNGKDGVCAWQLSGGSSEDFHLFFVDEISRLSLVEESFDGPRPRYRRGDRRFLTIYTEF